MGEKTLFFDWVVPPGWVAHHPLKQRACDHLIGIIKHLGIPVVMSTPEAVHGSFLLN